MRKVKRLATKLLTLSLTLTAVFAFGGCEEVYNVEETNGLISSVQSAVDANKTQLEGLIAELQTTINNNKTELDNKIAALTAEYKAKDMELLSSIQNNQLAISTLKSTYETKVGELDKADKANEEALAELEREYLAKVEELVESDSANASALETLKTDYETKVGELDKADKANEEALEKLEREYLAKVEELVASENANANALQTLKTTYETKVGELDKADKANEEALAKLKTEYLAKVEELEKEIETANAQIKANKTELESKISTLKTATNAKISQMESLLDTIQSTNATQDEKIAELLSRVSELEKGMLITDIVFADNGDLVFTFADGTIQTVEAPKKHVHTFDKWILFGAVDNLGEDKIFYRVCSSCKLIEWRQGTQYTITLMKDDSVWKTITVEYDQALESLPVLENMTDKLFNGWKMSDTGVKVVDYQGNWESDYQRYVWTESIILVADWWDDV